MKRAQRYLGVLLMIGYAASGDVAQAASYYVSKTGRNSNPGTEASPFLTINYGVSRIGAGDTLWVKAGTYDEALINNVPSGTSWVNKVRIASYPGDLVWLGPSSGNFVIYFGLNQQYVEFDGINLDGRGVAYDTVKIDGTRSASQNAHHIRVQNAELISDQTHKAGLWQHILVTALDNTIVGGNEFIRLVIHGGGSSDFDNGIYIGSSNNLVDGCTIYDVAGSRVQIYNGYGISFSGNVVRNCKIYGGALGASGLRHFGIIVASAAINTSLYNNLIYNLPNEGQSSIAIIDLSGTNTEIYNNTVAQNAGQGISLFGSGAIVKNNISYGNAGGDYSNSGTSTTASNNLFGTNPVFVNSGNRDFQLQASSPAVNSGTSLASVTMDLVGKPRPQGSGYDIGAYEFSQTSLPAAPTGLRIVQN